MTQFEFPCIALIQNFVGCVFVLLYALHFASTSPALIYTIWLYSFVSDFNTSFKWDIKEWKCKWARVAENDKNENGESEKKSEQKLVI